MRIVVFSGAGLSAESGIPTFRDKGGIWDRYDPGIVASHPEWKDHPAEAYRFWAELFAEKHGTGPNPAHQALARLAGAQDVVCVTQNIDVLLEAAGVPEVWHLHGRLDRLKCEWHASVPADGDPGYTCTHAAAQTAPIDPLDRCPQCGGRLRPDFVMFGERVDMRDTYLAELRQTADVFIAVGTSAQVYPAAGLIRLFAGTPQAFFVDPYPPASLPGGYAILRGPAGEQVPLLVERLLAGG